MTLFGVTGDLAKRKIVPALFQLFQGGGLPERFALVGFSRSAKDDESLREKLHEGVLEHARIKPVDEDAWQRFAQCIHAVSGDAADIESFARLGARLDEIDVEHSTEGNQIFYFATPASAFTDLLENLEASRVLRRRRREHTRPWQRVVFEKPFGHDLESAQELTNLARRVLEEHQIYRIDHYLGKETVQNLLVFRFGNMIFEPLWNRQYIDHVQITMAESIGVEGRGSFYEETGVVRDIVQNHLLQVLALCTMEPPVDFGPYEIRNMKSQVLRSLRPINPAEVGRFAVRGQYDGYTDEPGVSKNSRTPTYMALEAYIDNWRWNGVPFYLRAGKGLTSRTTEVALHFRSIPSCLFGDEDACLAVPNNVLKIRIQPDEGIALHVASKIPGEDMGIGSVRMDFSYEEEFDRHPPEAYERLLVDCMRGDPTLFARRDEVEFSWAFLDPLLQAWEADKSSPVATYTRGSDGPVEAHELIHRSGRRWEKMR
ncbi:MAG: glucose-6-phosphate 1-dehydrogenase [Planctomycetota bacterium]|jgi:glucose-6-phosphate 1-dehydrogenase